MAKKVGEIFVELGFLTEDQVTEVLSIQSESKDKKFGQIALEYNFINNDAINAYLEYKENEN